MTLDELLQQLMKIKEVHPDSGKFIINKTGWYREDNGEDWDISAVNIKKVFIENDKVVIS